MHGGNWIQSELTLRSHRIVRLDHLVSFVVVVACLDCLLVRLTVAVEVLPGRVAIPLPLPPLHLLDEVILVPLHVHGSQLELLFLVRMN